MLKRIYLFAESALAVIITIWLADSFIGIYRAGYAIKLSNPLESIYTREIISGKFYSIMPVLIIFAIMTLCGLIFGIKANSRAKIENNFIRVKPHESHKNLQVIIIITAIILIISGIINGSARDVLYKAINICTECIGLG